MFGRERDEEMYQCMQQLFQMLQRREEREMLRSSNPDLEALQKQFPGTPFFPLPHQVKNVVAPAGNYVKQIEVPSGAQLAIITSNKGVFVSRTNIVFPFTESDGAAYCYLHRMFWIRGVGNLTVGLVNAGDIASISFYSQMLA